MNKKDDLTCKNTEKSTSTSENQPFSANEKSVCEAIVAGFYQSGLITASEFATMKEAIESNGRAGM